MNPFPLGGFLGPTGDIFEERAQTYVVDDATNNDVTDIVTLRHTTTGTPAAGLGAGLLFQAENSVGDSENSGRVAGVLTTVTAGSEAAAVLVYSRTGGAALREVARFGPTEAVINEDGNADYDFRVEGDTNANLIFADASADALGLGAAAPTVNGRILVDFPTITVSVDANGAYADIDPALTEAASGTHAIMAGLWLRALTLTGAGAATTDASTLYVAGAPAGATRNYALWIDAGAARFDGTVAVNNNAPQGGSLLHVGVNGLTVDNDETAIFCGGTAANFALITTGNRRGRVAVVDATALMYVGTITNTAVSFIQNNVEAFRIPVGGGISAAGRVSGSGLTSGGDPGGVVSTTTISNVTAAADTNVPTFINTPTGIAAAQATWLKIYIGTTASYLPVWQ